MSVLIKGMKMPKGCWWYDENSHFNMCPVFDADNYCGLLNRCVSANKFKRPDDCPLIEVPPHGRLIDADKIPERYAEVRDLAPTVIEAEEGAEE